MDFYEILFVFLIFWIIFTFEKYRSNRKVFTAGAILSSLIGVLTVFLLKSIAAYISNKFNISLSPFDYLPESLQLWIGGIFMFSLACYISFMGWRKTKEGSNSEE